MICKRELLLFLLQTFNVVLVGLELSVTLVHFAIRRSLSIKLGTMLTTRAKDLAVIFSAWPTPMNNVFLKTSPILNRGWDIGTNPETGRGLGVTQVCPCLPTGTAVLRMITAKVETVSCWVLKKANGKMRHVHRLMNTFARKRLRVRSLVNCNTVKTRN